MKRSVGSPRDAKEDPSRRRGGAPGREGTGDASVDVAGQ